MDVFALILAILALVVAALAYQRSGGVNELRETTASILSKMGKALRVEEEQTKVKTSPKRESEPKKES